ncbi:hypothetical protein DFH06DRAFT_1145371 [Mycena polygramma]|nr:hypothetical protein DFH06DRAFT_1145371 [Mycena polygramma]
MRRLKRPSRKELVRELRSEELSLPALCHPHGCLSSCLPPLITPTLKTLKTLCLELSALYVEREDYLAERLARLMSVLRPRRRRLTADFIRAIQHAPPKSPWPPIWSASQSQCREQHPLGYRVALRLFQAAKTIRLHFGYPPAALGVFPNPKLYRGVKALPRIFFDDSQPYYGGAGVRTRLAGMYQNCGPTKNGPRGLSGNALRPEAMKRQLTEGLDTKSPTWHFHDPTHSPLAVFIFMGTVVDDAGPTLQARFAGKPVVSASDPREKNTSSLLEPMRFLDDVYGPVFASMGEQLTQEFRLDGVSGFRA